MPADPGLVADTLAVQHGLGLDILANDYIVTAAGAYLLEVSHIPSANCLPELWAEYVDVVASSTEGRGQLAICGAPNAAKLAVTGAGGVLPTEYGSPALSFGGLRHGAVSTTDHYVTPCLDRVDFHAMNPGMVFVRSVTQSTLSGRCSLVKTIGFIS